MVDCGRMVGGLLSPGQMEMGCGGGGNWWAGWMRDVGVKWRVAGFDGIGGEPDDGKDGGGRLV